MLSHRLRISLPWEATSAAALQSGATAARASRAWILPGRRQDPLRRSVQRPGSGSASASGSGGTPISSSTRRRFATARRSFGGARSGSGSDGSVKSTARPS
eukprot:8935561-Pyramimonas_sp.AAC.1